MGEEAQTLVGSAERLTGDQIANLRSMVAKARRRDLRSQAVGRVLLHHADSLLDAAERMIDDSLPPGRAAAPGPNELHHIPDARNMVDPDTSALAAELCVTALADHNDPILALLTLMQAAASLCVVRMEPAAFAVDTFESAAAAQCNLMASLLRPDRVRQ